MCTREALLSAHNELWMAKFLLLLGCLRCVGRVVRPVFACPAIMLFQMRHFEAHYCELWTWHLAPRGAEQ